MAKPTLILIPGLVCDETVWQAQVAALSNQYSIIIPNLNQAVNLQDMVACVLNGAPDQFILAGHSMGGWLALELMREHSHRVTKLCVLSTSASLDSAEKIASRNQLINLAKSGDKQALAELLTNYFVYVDTARDISKKMFFNNIDAMVTQQEILLSRKSCETLLPSISQPSLIIVGKQDEAYYQSSLLIAKKIPNAKFASIDNCGHMLTLERPEAVTALMRFWLEYD